MNNPSEKSRDAALAWFVRLHSGDATDADKSQHAAWLAQNSTNQTEYAKLDRLWMGLDHSRALQRMPRGAKVRASRRTFMAMGMAACAAGIIAVNPMDLLIYDHATKTAEQRELTLADGTRVEMDADTALDLDFTGDTRLVRLSRGRAFFDVAKDTGRPFVVAAADGTITALGTRFVVHEWSGSVTVSVEESAVSVSTANGPATIVKAGEYVVYDDKRVGSVTPTDIETEFAWRRGKLIFEDCPLRQVLADVNRYRRGTIRVTDHRLLDMRVSGIFDIRNPDGVLDAIRTTLPVKTIELSPWIVILRPV